MRFALDKGPELRARGAGTDLSESETGVISLRYGDSVVVPLRVELRDSLPIKGGGGQNNYGSQKSAEQEEKEIYDAITSAPMELFAGVSSKVESEGCDYYEEEERIWSGS